jgi:hypothetical protein
MSSHYRERKAAGLYDADEATREKAEKALNKDLARRAELGVSAVGDAAAEAEEINEQRIENVQSSK